MVPSPEPGDGATRRRRPTSPNDPPTRRGRPSAPSEPPAGRRRSTLSQARSQERRQTLLTAAEALWTDRGVDAVKVEEICDRAGVSKGLFYFYFARREDLLVDLTMARHDEIAATVDAAVRADEPVDEVLRRAAATTVRLAQRTPRHLLVRSISEWFGGIERHAVLADGHVDLAGSLGSAFAHGRARGELPPGPDPAALGATLAWSWLEAQVAWATSNRRQPALIRRLWERAELVLVGAGWTTPD